MLPTMLAKAARAAPNVQTRVGARGHERVHLQKPLRGSWKLRRLGRSRLCAVATAAPALRAAWSPPLRRPCARRRRPCAAASHARRRCAGAPFLRCSPESAPRRTRRTAATTTSRPRQSSRSSRASPCASARSTLVARICRRGKRRTPSFWHGSRVPLA
ncbi:hypothetical protein M885DRAFT_534908 [Pelagophyceae sp. CCMP2097]|nr:hypothetical protein M885DRAFT_534908 [Pelagophyceae sp. CCMP2097]